MDDNANVLELTELDRITALELAERIAQAEEEGLAIGPRRYPGYPSWPLPRNRVRWRPGLDQALSSRRSMQVLDSRFPDRGRLARHLQFAHGITGSFGRGPVPSAGGLQALELYLVHWQNAWLPAGVYHYDRQDHCVVQVAAGADAEQWRDRVPSLRQLSGGALLWLIVGDARQVRRKYGLRADRFLLLEAGHLMQNLCLLSTSLGLVTLPLGGVLEREVARALRLPPDDLVLYVGLCGGGSRNIEAPKFPDSSPPLIREARDPA